MTRQRVIKYKDKGRVMHLQDGRYTQKAGPSALGLPLAILAAFERQKGVWRQHPWAASRPLWPSPLPPPPPRPLTSSSSSDSQASGAATMAARLMVPQPALSRYSNTW